MFIGQYMRRRNRLIRILFLFLALMPACNIWGGPSANYYYFRTSSGGKIYCIIDDKTERTVKTTSKLSCRYKDSNFISVTFTRNVVQEVSGAVTIPSQVDLRHCDELYGIDESVGRYTVVGFLDDSFNGCSNLTSITLPSTTKTVAGAFINCTNLKTINLPTTIEYVSNNFAQGCERLEAVNVGSGQGVKYHSFDGILCCEGEVYFCPPSCKSDVVLPSTIKAIGNDVFANHHALLSVKVNSGATIGNGAFKNCTNLKDVILCDGVKSIGSNAFSDCVSIEQINIPGSVKEIGNQAFKGCLSLVSVKLNEGLDCVNNQAFQDCMFLKNISFPQSLRKIWAEAFANCTSLENITFPEGGKCDYTGTGAFYFCSSIKEIQFPSSMGYIGEKAFMGCTALERVVLNPQIKEIDRYAFFGCSSLSSINLPKETKIYEETFMQCDNLVLP